MRWLWLALCLIVTPIHAQTFNTIGAGSVAPVSSATYQGPGDVQSGWKAFYSCRAFSAATVGTKAYRIVRASDSTQTDINSLASGFCDTSTPATFCAATTCKVVTWYDQSGALACAGSTACDITNATSAQQPSWSSASLNGWPCVDSSVSTNVVLISANTLTLSEPYTIVGLSSRNASFTSIGRILSNAGTPHLSYTASANTVTVNAGTAGVTATASDSTFHVLQGVVTSGGASSFVVVDGTPGTTGAAGAGGFTTTVHMFNDASGAGAFLNGKVCEAGIVNTNLSAGQYGALNSNMHGAANGWNF